MGTRTAVFQEQANGEFIGIYVHMMVTLRMWVKHCLNTIKIEIK